MKNYLKKNWFSLVLGVVIGLPLALYANSHHAPATVIYQPKCEVYEIEWEYIDESEEKEMQNPDNYTAYFDIDRNDKVIDLLARCIEAEAGNQGLYGKQLVFDVILNRVDDPDFPDCITDVIMQPNQFSVVLDGRINEMTPTEETYEAIRLEFEHRQNTEVLFFTAEGFSKYGTPWMKIGDHYFSTKKVL